MIARRPAQVRGGLRAAATAWALALAIAGCAASNEASPGDSSGGTRGGGAGASNTGGGGGNPSGGSGGSGTGGGVGGSGGLAGSGGAVGGGGSAGDPGSGGSAAGAGGNLGGPGDAGSDQTSQTPPDGGPVGGEMGERSAGCIDGQGLAEGEATLMASGLNRTFRVRLPKGYSKEKAWPLVFALHPNGGSGIGFFDGDARPVRSLLADRAVLIVPLARPMGGGWDWRGNLPADLAFFDALITRVKSQLCIDTKRIFSMGFSGGASFSGVLGCRRTDIRAIASAGGVSYFDAKDCVGNPAAWIAIGQGELIASRTAFRDFWRSRAMCQTTSMPAQPSPCIAYSCPAETPVHYCQHPAGHIWPDFASKAAVDFFLKF